MGTRSVAFCIVLVTAMVLGTVGIGRAQATGVQSSPSGMLPLSLRRPPESFSAAQAGSVPATLVLDRGLVATWTHAPTVGPMVEVNGSLPFFNAEVESAVDPATGTLYDLWIANDGIGFARSTNGGLSFDSAFIIPGSENVFDPLNPKVWAFSWDPAIAIASDGIVYAAFMDASSSTNPAGSPYVAVSFDHGASFMAANPVLIPSKVTFSDREFLAVAPDGAVYVTWNYAPKAKLITFLCSPGGSCSYATGDFNLMITSSVDHGSTWSSPTSVSPNYPRGGSLEGPIVVGADGTIYVAFDAFPTAKDYALGPGQEWFTSSKDGGRTWTAPILLSGPYFVALQVWWVENTLAIGASGTLYAAWDVQTDQGDIGFVRYSLDGGVTWSPMIRVTPDVDNAAHIMQVAAGADGTAYLGWLTDNATNGAWGVYVATLSTKTGGVSAPTQVSSALGDPYWWPGDTLGMAYLGRGKVSLAWGAQVSPFWDNDGIFNVIVRYR